MLYSAALNDLREALDLEKQTILKIRSGMTIASMTKVNLLSKLKDRVDIVSANSSEMIKTLVHLPKAWTNEAFEKRAGTGDRKRKQKQPVAAGEEDKPNDAKRQKIDGKKEKVKKSE